MIMNRRSLLRVLNAVIVTMFVLGVVVCADDAPRGEDFAAAREHMVLTQIAARGISDSAVLAAVRTVQRHLFVPREYRSSAYDDYPLPIGRGQTISQPFIVALMTDLLEIDSTDRVLEIGTGSGYQAAVLGEIARGVYTIEIIRELGESAAALLDSLQYDNVQVRIGDGYRGWLEKAPFDAIIVTAAPPRIPQPLIDQLADSGRMVIPVGEGVQDLLLLQRIGDRIDTTSVVPVRFVPMTGEGVEEQR